MKVYLFIFTCKRDFNLLPYSVGSCKKIKDSLTGNDYLHIIACLDSGEEYSKEDYDYIRSLGVDQITLSKFPRKGNLNGSKCVVGMMDEFITYTPDDADFACQFDSDCILQCFGYFKSIKGELGGEALGFSDAMGGRFACAGPGLCIKKSLAKKIKVMAEDPKYAERIDKGPGYSDTMIGALAEMAGSPCHCLPYESAPLCEGSDKYRARVGMYFDEGKPFPNVAFCEMSAIIHFDNKNARTMAGSDDIKERLKLVELSMRGWYNSHINPQQT